MNQHHSQNATRSEHAPPATELLHDRTTQSGVALFAAYGIDLHPAAPEGETRAMEEITYLSISGFAGPRLSGIVVLGTTENVLQRSNRTTSSSSDWMAELANQLLGRIKNGLLREGIAIHRTPPAVVQGGAPALPYQRSAMKTVALRAGQDAVFIWTDAETALADAQESSDSPPETQGEVLGEGEMLLF